MPKLLSPLLMLVACTAGAAEVPVISLYHEKAPYAYRTTLRNLRQRINFQPTFDTMAKA